MLIQLCDRCGKQTDNKAAIALPVEKNESAWMLNGVYFGKTIVLCNDCLKDFDEFRYEHPRFNKNLTKD